MEVPKRMSLNTSLKNAMIFADDSEDEDYSNLSFSDFLNRQKQLEQAKQNDYNVSNQQDLEQAVKREDHKVIIKQEDHKVTIKQELGATSDHKAIKQDPETIKTEVKPIQQTDPNVSAKQSLEEAREEVRRCAERIKDELERKKGSEKDGGEPTQNDEKQESVRVRENLKRGGRGKKGQPKQNDDSESGKGQCNKNLEHGETHAKKQKTSEKIEIKQEPLDLSEEECSSQIDDEILEQGHKKLIKKEKIKFEVDDESLHFEKLGLKTPVKNEIEDESGSTSNRKSAKRTLIRLRSSPYSRPGTSDEKTTKKWENSDKLQGHQDEKRRNTNKNFEADPVVLSRRQKQIDFGKNTIGYDNYVKLVPKISRKPEDPVTPNKYRMYSRRGFDGLIKQWRLKLHNYDP